MENVRNVFVQAIEKPERKVIVKRGVKAKDYFAYCEEVGCDVWGLLTSIRSISGEPVCMWLPQAYIRPGTSQYVQGVEVSIDYDGVIPEGFEVIELPAARYLMFKGEPFKEEEYCQGVGHGYGLSQYGAKCMAEEGKTAEEILGFFYKNIVLISE